jgi:hypothetical protein
MVRVGRFALVIGLVLAAVLLATPRLTFWVAPADRAVARPEPPPEPGNPVVAPEYADAMVAAAKDAATSRMTLGAAVLDVATGDLAEEGEDEFYSASLSKLMLIVDLLDRDVTLSDVDMSLIGRALSLSDDEAMNSLWVKYDGPAAITRVATELKLPGTRTPDDPSQWGETEVSPAGFALLYQHILTAMTPDDRDVIVSGLSSAQPTAADGFDQFFGLLGQPGEIYAKQGWMYYGSRLYLHSAGVVHAEDRDYVVVLMSVQPVSATAPAAITAVASAMLGVLSAPSGKVQGTS